jgi:hypothetical protein
MTAGAWTWGFWYWSTYIRWRRRCREHKRRVDEAVEELRLAVEACQCEATLDSDAEFNRALRMSKHTLEEFRAVVDSVPWPVRLLDEWTTRR